MNSTINKTFLGLDYWYNLLGSKPIFELIYVFVLTPLCFVAFLLNLLTFLIINKIKFKKSTFYSYTKFYLLNSAILSLILMTLFVSATYRIFDFTNSYGTIFYGCYIYYFFLPVFYLSNSFIEVLMVFERMLYFLPAKFKRIKIEMELKKLCLLIFISSIIISLSDLFLFTPGRIQVELDQNTSFSIYFWNPTEFSNTLTYTIIGNLSHMLRDLVPLVLKIILNFISVKLMRKYFDRLRNEKLAFAQRISSSELHVKSKKENESNVFISKTDGNQTLIAVFMCIFSLFEHFFYIASYMFVVFHFYELAPSFFCISYISIALKNASNFFLFYKFNHLFRVQLKKSFSFKC